MAEAAKQEGEAPPKKEKRFTMSPEHKAKMAAGRAKKKQAEEEAARAAERGEVPSPDFTSISTKPRSLLDIFNFYPIGDGKHFVQVVRTHPKRFYDQNVAGVQQPIKQSMTEAEFASFYGGAEYELRVYVQDERADGTPFSKPLTDPIIYRVPGQPNLESVISEEDDVRYVPQNGSGRRMVGADRVGGGFEAPPVSIRRIQSNETMDERERAAARELRREEADARVASEERELRALDQVVAVKDRELERMEVMNEKEVKLAREAEAAKSHAQVERLKAEASKPDTLETLLRAKDLFMPNTQASADQVRQMSEAHKTELTRLHAEHEKMIRVERERADKLIKDAEERAERRIKDAEEKAERRQREIEETANRRVSEIEQRADARSREAERMADQRLQDLDRQHNNRFTDLKENHARELRQKDSEASMGKTQVEVVLNARVATLESDAKRLDTELSRARREADTYKKEADDWLGKLEKFHLQAEAMGYAKADEGGGEGEGTPKNWQEMAASIGMKLISNLPDVIESAGKALSGIRQGSANPAMQRQIQRHQMIAGAQGTVPHALAAAPQGMVQQTLPFATEDGAGFIPPMDQPMPFQPNQMPAPHETPMPSPPPQPRPVQRQQAAPPPQQQQLALVHEQPPQPMNQQSAPPAAPPNMGGDGAEFDQIIFGLAAHYDNKTPPAELVNMLMTAMPPDQRESLKMLTFEQVTAIVSQRKHEAAQKLMRREGHKYLKSVWTTLQTELARAPAA